MTGLDALLVLIIAAGITLIVALACKYAPR
jgi:hypothetical protein